MPMTRHPGSCCWQPGRTSVRGSTTPRSTPCSSHSRSRSRGESCSTSAGSFARPTPRPTSRSMTTSIPGRCSARCTASDWRPTPSSASTAIARQGPDDTAARQQPASQARASSRSVTPSWVETFEDLQSASTIEELWGVLLSWHGIRSSSVWDEPYLLFMRFHRHDSTDADITAALLCTDHRWRNASHHLIDRVAVSDVLEDEQLDVLADWFSGEDFEILIEHSDGESRGG